MKAEEFLKEYKKERNTKDAIYSSYHIDAMQAYAKHIIESLTDEEIDVYVDSLLPVLDSTYEAGLSLGIENGVVWAKEELLKRIG